MLQSKYWRLAVPSWVFRTHLELCNPGTLTCESYVSSTTESPTEFCMRSTQDEQQYCSLVATKPALIDGMTYLYQSQTGYMMNTW